MKGLAGVPSRQGFLWRLAERERAARVLPPAAEAGRIAAGWMQWHQPEGDAALFVAGDMAEPAVRRFAGAMFRRGWSLDICGDAEAAVESVAAAPARWALVAVFEGGDEVWSDLVARVRERAMMRLHLGVGDRITRVELRNAALFPRGLRPDPRCA